MDRIIAHIAQKEAEFAKLPLLAYARDEDIDAFDKFNWIPTIIPFALGFYQINTRHLRIEPADSEIQALINKLTYEDERHWLWFFEDLQKLGFNAHPAGLVDHVKFLWGEHAIAAHQLCAGLIGMLAENRQDPIIRFLVSECIESTGRLTLAPLCAPALELEKRMGLKLPYFGPFHVMVELGYRRITPEKIEQFVADVIAQRPLHVEELPECVRNAELDPEREARALAVVDEVFRLFSEMLNSAIRYAQQRLAFDGSEADHIVSRVVRRAVSSAAVAAAA
jgi:hypothetical protein